MTYQEALDAKAKYGKSITKNNSEFLVLIAPKDFNDLVNFLADYKEDTYTDEFCKIYALNNEYQLYANMNEHSRRLLF